jgi:hypothetical protein
VTAYTGGMHTLAELVGILLVGSLVVVPVALVAVFVVVLVTAVSR